MAAAPSEAPMRLDGGFGISMDRVLTAAASSSHHHRYPPSATSVPAVPSCPQACPSGPICGRSSDLIGGVTSGNSTISVVLTGTSW